jgi:flagellin-like protein
MKLRKTYRNVKAVSPVIATIIIVAITIVMAIAVAYWMLGLGGAFTRFEKLEFQSGYATARTDDVNATLANYYNISLRFKNTGSAVATVDLVFFNGVPQMEVADLIEIQLTTPDTTVHTFAGSDFNNMLAIPVAPGDSITGIILMERNVPPTTESVFKPGMSLELMIQTAAGNQYPKVIVLS